MKAVARRALEILGEFNAQELANTVWAFAKLEAHDDALLEAVAPRALEILDQFNAQELANTWWAFAKLDAGHESLMDSLRCRARTLQGIPEPLARYLSSLTLEELVIASVEEPPQVL